MASNQTMLEGRFSKKSISYTHDELFEEVRKHLKKEYKLEVYDADAPGAFKGYYTEEEATNLAKELVQKLQDAFLDSLRSRIWLDDYRWGARITYSVKPTTKGEFRVHINFPAKYLLRHSLIDKDHPTVSLGSGIDDIFALKTRGYKVNKPMPAGSWWSSARQGEIEIIHAPYVYPTTSFITRTIENFEKKYKGIHVEYPDEWHS